MSKSLESTSGPGPRGRGENLAMRHAAALVARWLVLAVLVTVASACGTRAAGHGRPVPQPSPSLPAFAATMNPDGTVPWSSAPAPGFGLGGPSTSFSIAVDAREVPPAAIHASTNGRREASLKVICAT